MSFNALFKPGKELLAAITIGLIVCCFSSSMGILIFSDPILSPYVIIGMTSGLLGAIILNLNYGLFSSSKIAIPTVQPIFGLIGSIVAADICKQLHGVAIGEILSTVLTSVIIMGISTGLCMWLIGKLKFGNIINFVPYPINAGFLGGIGLLIISNTMVSITHLKLIPQNSLFFFQAPVIWQWLAPLLYALCTYLLIKRYKNQRILPLMLLISILIFYSYIFINHISLAQASSFNWTLEHFSNQTLAFLPIFKISYSQIHWQVVAQQWPSYFSLAILANTQFSLNQSALSLMTQKTGNINHELKLLGLANISLAMLGAIGGFQGPNLTKINMDLNTKNKSITFSIAIFLGIIFLIGSAFFYVMPRITTSFLLMYLGISLGYPWLISIKQQISLCYYLIVLVIAFSILCLGSLHGIIIGLILTILLFLFQYSQITTLNTLLNGSLLQSNVQRGANEIQILAKNGRQILIPVISGYLFFGNSNILMNKIKRKIKISLPDIRFVVIDFSRVTGMEISCYQSLVKLLQYCKTHQIKVLLSKLPNKIKAELYQFITNDLFSEFDDLDHSLEWCEQQILDAHDQPSMYLSQPEYLFEYAITTEIKAGEVLFNQGDNSHDLYWLEKGTLDVWSHFNTPQQHRLSRIYNGNIIGEMSMFMNTSRSASVVAGTDCLLYCITPQNLKRLYQEQPQIGIQFNEFIIKTLCTRLLNANHFNHFMKSQLMND